MRKFLLIPIFVFLVSISLSAQTANPSGCPSTSIMGPSGIVDAGEIAIFSATIDQKNRQLDIKYLWSVSSGEIVKGQGTSFIEVRVSEGNLTVTVKIKGLPEGCPNTASETAACGLRPPEAVKMDTFTEPLSKIGTSRIETIKKSILDNPNDIFLVFVGVGKDGGTEGKRRRVDSLFDAINTGKEDGVRIIFVDVESAADFFQIWRVPPGSNRPKCEGCSERGVIKTIQRCPAISVMGPAGVTNPGDEMIFTTLIDGTIDSGLGYVWKATGGEIVKGQGTAAINVRIPTKMPILVTATVEVNGLPEGYTHTATEVAAEDCKCTSHRVDGYGSITLRDEKLKIDKALLQLKTEPNSMLYIIKYFPTLNTDSRRRMENLTQYMVKQKTIPKTSFKILDAIGTTHTIVYLVPPGADIQRLKPVVTR